MVIALSWFQHNLLVNLFLYGWLPLLGYSYFILGSNDYLFAWARYRDFYQLVPIVLQLVFLLSPILYRKDNLGVMAWTANLNPFYRVLGLLRHSDSRRGPVVCKFDGARPQSPWYVGCVVLVESRTPSPSFPDLKLFVPRPCCYGGSIL